jgi:hypothetical protein
MKSKIKSILEDLLGGVILMAGVIAFFFLSSIR